MTENDPGGFLDELTAALTDRGWTAKPMYTVAITPSTEGERNSLAEFTSPTADRLRVRVRRHPGHATAELDAVGWRLDLTAARSVTAALAAIDAAEAVLERVGAGMHDERSVPELLHAAGWDSSRDHEGRYGVENTWYSPDGTRRLRNSHEHAHTRGWILALAPTFADGHGWTANDDTPAAVIAALAITA